MNEWTLIYIVVISEAFLHYFPWLKLLKGKTLPRLLAYVFGVLGLMIPFTVWLLSNKDVEAIETAVTLWKVIAAGGIIVFALYGFDHYLELEWRDRESTEREEHRGKKG